MSSVISGKPGYFVLSSVFLLIASALAIATTINQIFMQACFMNFTYYLLALLVIAWVIVIIQDVQAQKTDIGLFLKEYGLGILFSVVLVSGIFVSVEPFFRLLSDETNLLSVSRSMTYSKSVGNVTQGIWDGFVYYPIEAQMPKRPFLFPFLTHVLHSLFGYRVYHPFVVNYLSLCSVLSILFIMIKKHYGKVIAYAGLLFVVAQPVVSETAASGAFDLLCVLFLVLSVFSLDSFLTRPSAIRFQTLWVHLLLLANTRYEAPLYFIVVMALLFWFKRIKLEYFRLSFIYPLTPLVMLPTFWQRLFVETNLQVPEGESALSIGNFIQHNKDFLHSLFRFDFYLPYATIINLLGTIALVYYVYLFLARKWPEDSSNRVLKQVMIQDAEEADKTFDMLMGSEVPPRKSFIQTHAKMANLDI